MVLRRRWSSGSARRWQTACSMSVAREPSDPSDHFLEMIGVIGALVILVVVAAVRLPSESMWLDEAFTRGAMNDFGFDLTTFRGTMILYMGFVWAWARVSDATWWIRVPSVLAAGGSLVVLRVIARRIGGARLVAVALPVCALSVGFQWVATDARAYAFETLLTAFAWYCFFAAGDARSDRIARRWWWTLAATSVLGVACHGLFVVQLVPLAAVAVVRDGVRGALAELWPTALAGGSTVGAFIIAGALAQNGTYTSGGIGTFLGAVLNVFIGPNVGLRTLLSEVALVGVVIAYLHARRYGTRESWPSLVPAAWAFGPVIVLAVFDLVTPVDNPRYILAALPGFALLLASVALAVSDRLVSRRVRPGAALLVCAVPLVALLALTALVTPYPTHADWRGAARMVAGDARPGDGIVFADAAGQFPQFTRPAFEAAWAEHERTVTPVAISPSRPLGRVRSHDAVLSTKSVVEKASRCRRVWFVQAAGGVQDRITPITSSASRWGFEKVGDWTFAGDIHIELWAKPARSER